MILQSNVPVCRLTEVAHGSVSAVNYAAHGWFTDLAMGHSGVVLWPTALSSANHPAVILTVSKGQLVSMAPFSWLSIMTVIPHYKDIMRVQRELHLDGRSNLLSLSPFLFLSLCVFVCVCVLVSVDMYFSLKVKPTISEAELPTGDVQPYMFGKQHQLTCTAYGLPLPTIAWLWQPCHSDPAFKRWVTISQCAKQRSTINDFFCILSLLLSRVKSISIVKFFSFHCKDFFKQGTLCDK